MNRNDDSQQIADRMNESIVSLISKYWKGWAPKGKTQAMLTPRIKKGQKNATSSFIVDIAGANQGRWYRHSQSVGGYALSLILYAETGRVPNSKEDWAEAFWLARDFLGMPQQREISEEERQLYEQHRAVEEQRREAERKAQEAREEKKRERRIFSAQEVWAETVPIAGTAGEKYLESRGIPPISEWPWSPDDVLRFHPALEFEPMAEWEDGRKVRSGPRFPAVLAKVVDAFGDLIAVWQIYLDPDKPAKADLEPSPKIGRGPAAGGAVRLGGDAESIGGAEGVESALGAWALENFRMPVWAFLSTSGMRSFEPPINVERLVIWPDGDRGQLSPSGAVHEPPGIEAARALQGRMKAAGIKCVINDVFMLGDALDLLNTKRKYEQRQAKAS